MEIKELTTSIWNDYLYLREQLGGVYNKKDWNEKKFEEVYSTIKNQGSKIYVLLENNNLIATGRVNIEIKFFDNVAQIEDVVVNNKYRGKGYGTILIKHLVEEIKKNGTCYKTVLLTKDHLEGFYKKSEYKKTGISMTQYI